MDSHTVKNLNLLKKLSLQKSDLLRLEMYDYLSEIDQLKINSEKLIEQRLQEEGFAAKAENVEFNLALDAYREKQKTKLVKNKQLSEEIEKSYGALRDQLSELFSEQKSYEITIDDFTKKVTVREKQEELHFFDEVSMQRWRSR